MPALDLTPAEQALVDAAIAFSEQHVVPNAQAWEDRAQFPADALKAAAAAGLTGLQVPVAQGGAAARFRVKLRLAEDMARHDFAFTFALINTMGAASKVALGAPEDVAAQYLPGLLSGDLIGCTALTEPGAGSDFAAIRTRARKVDGGWLLNGEKAWITNAAGADVIHLYAQTDPGLGWRGVAGFLVDARQPGVTRTPPFHLMGGHAIGAGGFVLSDHFVPDERLLSPPGDGFKAAITSVNAARTYVAAMCCGMTEAAVQLAAGYAANRPAFGATIADLQGLRWRLADAQTDIEAARLLAYRAALTVEAGGDAQVEAAHAKKFAARMADRHLPDCMQVMGAAGLLREYPLARHIACARIANYVDGTTEIQNERIARDLFSGLRR